MKTQSNFRLSLLVGIIVVLAIIAGVYFYQNRTTQIQSPQNNSEETQVSCSDYGALSNFVLNTIAKPDAQTVLQPNPNVITSFRWRRSADEPFVSYPISQGMTFEYGYDAATTSIYRSNDAITSLIQGDADQLNAKIGTEAATLGLTPDELNTVATQYNSIGELYRGALGFRKGSDLYSIALTATMGGQAPADARITVTCGQASSEYDKVYDALNLKANPQVSDPYDFDYMAIADISPDHTVYALLGSSIRIANYYYFNGTNIKQVSADSYPAKCATLESLSVGEGMRCVDGSTYNQRTVSYANPDMGTGKGTAEVMPPVIQLTYPTGGESFKPGDHINITWTSPVNYPKVDIGIVAGKPDKCSEYTNNGSMGTCKGYGIYSGPNTGSYNYTVPTEYPDEGEYLITIQPDVDASTTQAIETQGYSLIDYSGYITITQ